MIAVNPVPFKARWSAEIEDLKPSLPTRLQSVTNAIWNAVSILFFPLGIARLACKGIYFFARTMTLPSSWAFANYVIWVYKQAFIGHCEELSKTFDITKRKIETPDHALLSTIHFRHKQASKDTPTIVFFQSNASMIQFGIYFWLIDEAVKRGSICNFVAFNYRGVGHSTGQIRSARDLILDGETILQYVRDGLGVLPDQTNIYAWSLGAAIASAILARHPEYKKRFVNERSFFSQRSVGMSHIPRCLRPLFFWIPLIAEKQGWNLTAPIEKLNTDTLFIKHPDDDVIRDEAAAHRAALLSKLHFSVMKLCNRKGAECMEHHSEWLQSYDTEEGIRADIAAANFILPK